MEISYIPVEEIDDMVRDLEGVKRFGHTLCDIDCMINMLDNLHVGKANVVSDSQWTEHDNGTRFCLVCGEDALCNVDGVEVLSAHCPHCGAKLA